MVFFLPLSSLPPALFLLRITTYYILLLPCVCYGGNHCLAFWSFHGVRHSANISSGIYNYAGSSRVPFDMLIFWKRRGALTLEGAHCFACSSKNGWNRINLLTPQAAGRGGPHIKKNVTQCSYYYLLHAAHTFSLYIYNE